MNTFDATTESANSARDDSPAPLIPGISRQYLIYHQVCPSRIKDAGKTLLLIASPSARLDDCVDELSMAYDATLIVDTRPWPEVSAEIERLSAGREMQQPVDHLVSLEIGVTATLASDDTSLADVRDLAIQPPVVRYVNLLIRDAQAASASDIHLEATRNGLIARVRIDGVLSQASHPPAHLAHAVVSRIKLLAELDIAEKRKPQDGRIRVRLESRELDIRVSTVPTGFGESVVLRLLDGSGKLVELDALGLAPAMQDQLVNIVRRPHGLLLVTGPTGSGKTTTLYACLQQRDLASEKVITVEDPIEYQLPRVTQVPVHQRAGVTFATALRSILRQDPDAVLIGEMRDPETAQIAVQAAMTGHLVLSTLHTNDAISAIPRLQDLGVMSYLVAATLEGVLAQRLVRRICEFCKVPSVPTAAQQNEIALIEREQLIAHRSQQEHFAVGTGCESCRGTGYGGRVGIYELLLMTEELREVITRGGSRAELRRTAAESGLISYRSDGYAKARAGVTTIAEVQRVSIG